MHIKTFIRFCSEKTFSYDNRCSSLCIRQDKEKTSREAWPASCFESTVQLMACPVALRDVSEHGCQEGTLERILSERTLTAVTYHEVSVWLPHVSTPLPHLFRHLRLNAQAK